MTYLIDHILLAWLELVQAITELEQCHRSILISDCDQASRIVCPTRAAIDLDA